MFVRVSLDAQNIFNRLRRSPPGQNRVFAGEREIFENRRKSLPRSSGGVLGAAEATADSIIQVPGRKSDGFFFWREF